MGLLQDGRVLVTGAEGFIGSHLTEALVKSGCRVRAFVLYNSFNSWGWLDTLPREILKDQVGGLCGRYPRPALCTPSDEGFHGGDAPGSADRDSLFFTALPNRMWRRTSMAP